MSVWGYFLWFWLELGLPLFSLSGEELATQGMMG
jgi:hypothetical protein